jgi:hypothetical protein
MVMDDNFATVLKVGSIDLPCGAATGRKLATRWRRRRTRLTALLLAASSGLLASDSFAQAPESARIGGSQANRLLDVRLPQTANTPVDRTREDSRIAGATANSARRLPATMLPSSGLPSMAVPSIAEYGSSDQSAALADQDPATELDPVGLQVARLQQPRKTRVNAVPDSEAVASGFEPIDASNWYELFEAEELHSANEGVGSQDRLVQHGRLGARVPLVGQTPSGAQTGSRLMEESAAFSDGAGGGKGDRIIEPSDGSSNGSVLMDRGQRVDSSGDGLAGDGLAGDGLADHVSADHVSADSEFGRRVSGNSGMSASAPPAIWNVYISNPQPTAPPPLPPAPSAPISIYNVPPVVEKPIDEGQERRERIAKQVSEEILGDRLYPQERLGVAPVSGSVTPVHLLRECEERAIAADGLLKRGATFAAREEVVGAIRCLASASDLQQGGRRYTESLEEGLSSLREAGDFLGRYGNVDAEGIARMVASHETMVLKDRDLSSLTAHAAADSYLDHARINLMQAVNGHPQGARLLMLLANSERARSSDKSNIADAIAITCLRAAVGSNSKDPLLASELGYHTMRAGLLGEAKWALERSLATQPSVSAMQNLIETHRLAGNVDRARQLAASLPNQGTQTKQPSMLVTAVPSSTFAKISPPVQPVGTRGAQPYQSTPALAQQPISVGRQAAQGFSNSPSPQPSQPSVPNTEPSVLDRMAGAIKGVWR